MIYIVIRLVLFLVGSKNVCEIIRIKILEKLLLFCEVVYGNILVEIEEKKFDMVDDICNEKKMLYLVNGNFQGLLFFEECYLDVEENEFICVDMNGDMRIE